MTDLQETVVPAGGGLTDAERFPILSPVGFRFLESLRSHRHAPRWTYAAGERLDHAGLSRVHAYTDELAVSGPAAGGSPPAWVMPWVREALADVPHYREWAADGAPFQALPTTTRAELSQASWRFVPDGADLKDLISYPTSGTTGHPLLVPSHPVTVGMYVPLILRALALSGVELKGGIGSVAFALVGFQAKAYTFASVVSVLGEAGYVKLNLHPDDWRRPDDRRAFLDQLAPEVITGDPLAFAELATLGLSHRPKALISTAMALAPAFGADLTRRFGCPVLDLYSLNESGPVAVRTGGAPHRLLPHDLYVEVLRADGSPAGDGERGEITLTGGRNPYLPLVRYRTGDWAALTTVEGSPALQDLEGRPPTVFRSAAGAAVNNLDVTWALRPLPLAQWTLHQAKTGALTLRATGAGEAALRAALEPLFGGLKVTVEPLPAGAQSGKLVQYTREDD